LRWVKLGSRFWLMFVTCWSVAGIEWDFLPPCAAF
jgi:hypothetical protein